MNIVKKENGALEVLELKLEDLCFINFDDTKTAFIGRCHNGPENALYLVAYDVIALAEDPSKTWGCKTYPVYVYKFVDIEIKVK